MFKIKRMIASYPEIRLEQRDGAKLRGFFAAKDINDILLHQHDAEKFRYRYPLVQYKVLHHTPHVVAFEEGISSVYPQLMEDAPLTIGDTAYPTDSLTIRLDSVWIGDCKEMRGYRFATPWLCLNQENYRRYQESTPEEKTALLDKILIGNILSLTKSLGIEVKGRLEAKTELKEIAVNFKNERMRGFIGGFWVNYTIPDLLGLGKSVSRGFGTVKHIKEQKGDCENELL